MSETWPADVAAYSRSPDFTEGTIPAALLRDHATKAGVWARLHVLEGSLRFVDQENGAEVLLRPGIHDCILPGRLHHVAPAGPVRFFVEFCRRRDDSAIDESEAFPHR